MSWTGRLRFAHKMAGLPVLASIGFVSILATLQLMGMRNARLLDAIQQRNFPAYEASDSLQQTLTALQRSLQDAVAASDAGALAATDGLRDQFLATLQKAGEHGAIEAGTAQALGQRLGQYYTLARKTSQGMIGGTTGEGVVAALQSMTAQYKEVRGRLDDLAKDNKRQMEIAFSTARTNQRSSVLVVTVMTMLSILALSVLSYLIIRALTRPLAEAVQVAERLAEGDLSAEVGAGSADEIGDFARAQQRMIAYFREMAGVANGIARGDLRAAVAPRSRADLLVQAFEQMAANLRRILTEVKESAEQVAAATEEL